jgi:hypothetical protein
VSETSPTGIIEDRVARLRLRSSPDTLTIAGIAARLPLPRPADVGISHTADRSRIYARLAAAVCGIGIRRGRSIYSRSRVLTPCSLHVGCCREPRSRILHLIRVSLALTETVAVQVYGLVIVMDLLASGPSLNLFQLTQMGIPCKGRIGSSRLERFPSGKDISSRPRIALSPTQNCVSSGFEGYETSPVSGVLR